MTTTNEKLIVTVLALLVVRTSEIVSFAESLELKFRLVDLDKILQDNLKPKIEALQEEFQKESADRQALDDAYIKLMQSEIDVAEAIPVLINPTAVTKSTVDISGITHFGMKWLGTPNSALEYLEENGIIRFQ